MSEELTYRIIARGKAGSSFDWINIERGFNRIGKVRAHINESTLTIYSINIFPEFERNGYAKGIINTLKKSFLKITADRVRYSAIGFWVKMGFVKEEQGKYVYLKKK